MTNNFLRRLYDAIVLHINILNTDIICASLNWFKRLAKMKAFQL
jgi:hypothetical protein